MSSPCHSPATAWTIAGSDSSGLAGLQIDLACFRSLGVHGGSVVTAVTAQNQSTFAGMALQEPSLLEQQISMLASQLPPKAIKLGMLGNKAIISTLIPYLEALNCPIVCDPVLKSSSGATLLDSQGQQALVQQLLTYVTLITPNIPELECLTGSKVTDYKSLINATEQLLNQGAKAILVTGGHSSASMLLGADYFTDGTYAMWLYHDEPLPQEQVPRGSGCILSSAVAASLAQDYALEDAIFAAKAFIHRAIRTSQQLGEVVLAGIATGQPSEIIDYPQYSMAPAIPKLKSASTPNRFKYPTCGPEPLGLYPIVDSPEWLEKLLPLGVTSVQLRIKNTPQKDLSTAIKRSVLLAHQYKARLFINDYWELALEHGAYGVHLGQEDLQHADLVALATAGLRLGISCHSYREIFCAWALNPSYIALGPIFPTTSKEMSFAPQGISKLQHWVQLLQKVPCVAIGGINRTRLPQVNATGVNGIAMISAITDSNDYRNEVSQMLKLLQSTNLNEAQVPA